MTLAWAFTDYRSQGQTLPFVIIDIATPPSGKPLTLFDLYIALSRSRRRANIRILRDFDESIFFSSHDSYLADEDSRLQRLNENTKKQWK
ncbi:hypothetical protein BDN70DRAFT_820350 [Pholiota conissans]|uniref:UvrD-like helicase C-terminal domain-containing protein n=1 Tax=Pholiota conissans TaxID=109636 RepID=A0A9P5YMB7_9AGAR|nr:hypothetical protein BDN70DRAFT_820350 [Pholiota conissans]